MKRKIVAVASAVAGVLGLVGIVGFRCGGQCHARDPARIQAMVNEHVDDTLDDLNATPDQRTQVHAVVDRLLAGARKLHEADPATHEELIAQWKSDRPDAARVRALVDRRMQEFRSFADEAIDAAVQVHGILTPEQRAKLAKKMERHSRH